MFALKKQKVQIYLSIMIFIASLFMGIGFAAAGNVTLNISSTSLVEGEVLEPYILNATLSNNVGANTAATNVAYSGDNTFANFSLSLSASNPSSLATYTITIMNPTDKDYYFDDVLYEMGGTTYSNENIIFEIDGINSGDKLLPESSKTFNITFHYKDDIIPSIKTLTALLNFKMIKGNFLSRDWGVLAGFKSSYNSAIAVNDVQSITFYSNGSIFSGTPIDVSEEQDENILLYKVFDTNTAKYDLKIVSNDKIYFPIDSSYLFGYYYNLNEIDFNNSIDTKFVTNMSYMFRSFGYNVQNVELSLNDFDTSNVTNMSYMFYGLGYNAQNVELDLNSINTSNVINMSYMFCDLGYSSKTLELNISNLNTKNVTDMSNMFRYAGTNSEIFDIDVSNFNTRSVTNMSGMFYYAGRESTIFEIDSSNWNTENVTNMSYIFYSSGFNSNIWTVGDLGNWNTSKVTDMSFMFNRAGVYTKKWSIGNLKNWDTSSVENMSGMFEFSGYYSMTWYIGDISHWDTSNVISMGSLFQNISGSFLEPFELDLSGWDTRKVTNMVGMFYNCRNLSKIYIGENWSTENVVSSILMFQDTYLLPNFNENFIEASKAVSECKGGYLTIVDEVCGNTLSQTWAVKSGLKSSYSSENTANDVQSITFYSNGSTFSGTPIDVSELDDQSILLYKVLDTSTSKYDLKITSNDIIYMPSDSSYLLSGFRDLNHIDFNDSIDTCNVNNMSYMFEATGYNVESLEMDLSDFNTRNVTNMVGMFHNTGYNATAINLGEIESWNTRNVNNISYMFSGFAENVINAEFDFSHWNVRNVTNVEYTFYYFASDSSHVILNLEGWKFSDELTSMYYMFAYTGCNADTLELNLYNWDTSNIKYMSSMFYYTGYNAGNLSIIGIDTWNTSNVVNMSSMFYYVGYASSPFTLDLSGWNTSKVSDMSYMFYSSINISKIYIGDGWSTESLNSGYSMFYGLSLLPNFNYYYDYDRAKSECEGGYLTIKDNTCKNILSRDWAILAGYKSSYNGYASITNVQSITFYSNNSSFSGTPIDVSQSQDGKILLYKVLDTNTSKYDLKIVSNDIIYFPYDSSYLFAYFNNVSNIDINNSVKSSFTENMSYMFYYTGQNATIFEMNLSTLNTSKVANMRYMFYYAGYNATTFELDLSNWNTSKVTDMSLMFKYAGYKATSWSIEGLSDWDTRNVTDMSSMFSLAGYNATTFELDLSNFITSNVTNMSSMFYYAGFFATIWSVGDISDWNTSKVTDMSSMFEFAGSKVTTAFELDLSGWDTSNVTNMVVMFAYAGANASDFIINLSGWDTSNVENMNGMFEYSDSLSKIYVSDKWNTQSVTTGQYMFLGSTSLVGGNGTTYDSTHYSYTYARIDGDEGPGYLTNISSDPYVIKVFSNDTSMGTTSGRGVYNLLQTVTLTATPQNGNSFLGWYENDILVSTNSTYTFNAVKDRTIIGKFNTSRTLSIISENQTYGSAIGSGIYAEGSEVIISATQNLGYKFSGWYDNDNHLISNQYTYSFIVPNNDVSYIAKYEEYTGPIWSITKAPDASYEFIQNKNGYYESNNKGIDNSAAVSVITIDVPSNNTKIDLHCINYAESGYDYGIIGILDEKLNNLYYADSTVAKTFRSYNQSTEQIYSFNNVSAGIHTIYIKYIKNATTSEYNDSLQFKVGFNGNQPINTTISNSTLILINENPSLGTISGGGTNIFGSEVIIHAIPNEGYKFMGWYNGDTFVSGSRDYAFTAPSNNLTLTAKFDVYVSPTWLLRKASDASYEFIENENGYYESNNKGIASSAAVSIITVNVPTNNTSIDLHCINYAQEGYDYGVIGVLNGTLSGTYSYVVDSTYAHRFYEPIYNKSTEQIYSFNELEAGTYTIYIKYRKDSSIDSNNDSLQFKVGFDGHNPIERVIINRTLTLTNANPTYGTISGSGNYDYGSEVTINAIDGLQYKFLGWYDGDTLISDKKNYSFIMPNNNLSYTARFEEYESPTWTLKKASGSSYEFVQNENGYYESNNKGIANSAAVSVITVDTPNDNTTIELHCINYSDSYFDYGLIGVLDGTLTTSNTADSNIAKSFSSLSQTSEQIYTFTGISAGIHTIYIKYIKNGSYDAGNDSLQFKVSFDGKDPIDRTVVNRTITLTNANTSYGTISGSGTYEYGSDVTINAITNNGYKFSGWYDSNNNLISSQKNYTFVMPNSDLSYTARFEIYTSPIWNLTKAPGASYEFVKNTNGYYESNNKGIANSAAVSIITVNVPSNGTTIDLHCINYAQASFDYGIIGILDGTLSTSYISDSTFAYRFYGSTYNKSTEQIYSFTNINAGTHTIYIKYIKNGSTNSYNDSLQFKVSFDGNDPIDKSIINKSITLTNANTSYGTISGSGTYEFGSNVTLTASANNGYIFSGWYDGSNNLISKNRNYTFTMPNNDLSYTARFEVYAGPAWTLQKASGSSYEFIQNANGYYESNNKGVDYSAAVSVITVNVLSNGTTIDLHCINYAENNYDYGLIGVLDGTLTTTYTADTNVAKSFKGLNQSTEQIYSFTGVSAGTHTIYIKYLKDSSSSSYNDSLQFKVGFDGNDPVDAS